MNIVLKSVSDFPDLKGQVLGVDTETYDPDLLSGGPGWGRGPWGNIVGTSLATLDGHAWYFPTRHEAEPEDNLDIEQTNAYLKDILEANTVKIGANCMYDYGWFREDGIKPGGMWYDVQFAEALIDEHAFSYALDKLAGKYLGEQKSGNEVYEWCAAKYGGPATRKAQGGNIYRCPPRIVGPYACDDARLALKVLQQQQHVLDKFELTDLFQLECELIPLVVEMRRRGFRIDSYAAHEAKDSLFTAEQIQRKRLNELAGFEVNENSAKSLATLFTKRGLEYPRTEIGNPSFKEDWLSEQTDLEEARLIVDVRKLSKARKTFVENAILDKSVNGRINPSLHPLRSDSGGTVTGRFSCSQPNGQQIPARDDVLGPLIRNMFIPDEGHPYILVMDYSQIEYRLFASFSGSRKLIEGYKDPNQDFHELVGSFLGIKAHRSAIKTVNFAVLYGAMLKKITAMLRALGVDLDPVEFLRIYNERFPEAMALMKQMAQLAAETGEIRTLLGRRMVFNKFRPKGRREETPLFYKEAKEKYGHYLERADTYKALNRLCQGSAADILKKGLVLAYRAGIFDRIGYPHLLVHDEIDMSYHPDFREDVIELKYIMENAIPLSVPIKLSCKMGPTWGSTQDISKYGLSLDKV